MEHHAQSIDDALIGGLSYKLKAGASYVTNRRSVSYFASGGNDYSTAGVRVMKFNINGDQWLDPSTFKVQFRLNKSNQATPGVIHPIHYNPAIFFSRARLIVGGVVVEDINDFDRLSCMLAELKSEEEQHQIACQGFGYEVNGDTANRNLFNHKAESFTTARVVCFSPMLRILIKRSLFPFVMLHFRLN